MADDPSRISVEVRRDIGTPADGTHAIVELPPARAGQSVPVIASIPVADRLVDGTGAIAAPRPTAPSPWAVAHRALRGRYGGVLCIALLCAAAGAVAGWRQGGRPLYRSEGLIRFPSARQDVEWRAQSYDVFMQSQVVRITSRGMVDLALQQSAWQATGRGSSLGVVKDFADGLVADVKPKTEYIRVSFTDQDPATAAAAVRSIIGAYEKTFIAERAEERRAASVEPDREALAIEVRRLEEEVHKYIDEFHTTDLDPVCGEVQQRLAKLKGTLSDVRLALTVARPSPTSPAGIGAQALQMPQPPTFTPERLAMVDGVMRSYLDEQRRCEDRLADLKDRLGDAHPEVLRANQALGRATARVTQYLDEYRRYMADTGTNPFAHPGQPVADMLNRPREELQKDEQQIEELIDEAQGEAKHDSEARYALQGILADLHTKRDELGEKDRRLAALRGAEAQSDGMDVLGRGDVPLVPMRDNRPRFAVGGALFGGMVPIGLVVGVSLLRRTYRCSDDATGDTARETPLLAILPSLDGGRADPATTAAAAAAQNVHQMRVMLQVMSGPTARHRAYLVTSACAGEGKTSVTMALGLSFAASGARTVVVDGDWMGRALTRSFRAQAYSGLREAIASRSLRGHLRKTLLLPQLCLLPAGRDAGPQDASTVSPEEIRWLMEHLRKYFDVVLFDSGPMLGSIEASLLAREVDDVLVVISRGQQQDAVDRAVARLSSLGACVKGFIFNRARRGDFIRSTQVSSYGGGNGTSNRSGNGDGHVGEEPRRTSSRDLMLKPAQQRGASIGPLADAVLASVRVG